MMAADADWSVVFFLEDSGASPVEEFLDSLDPKTQRRLAWSIEQLRLRNVGAREPLARHLDGKLWELREESQTNIYRVIYFFLTGRRIVFVHGFQKKTQKTLRREIELAQRRREHYIRREGGEP
jgi:phage-related protein